jgi:hypothetical protein
MDRIGTDCAWHGVDFAPFFVDNAREHSTTGVKKPNYSIRLRHDPSPDQAAKNLFNRV